MSAIHSFDRIFSQMSSQPNQRVVEEVEEYSTARDVFALDGTRLIPVWALPPKYRPVFSKRFPTFNCVQSKVFEDVFHSNKSIGI